MKLNFENIKFKHTTSVQIRFNDLDMMGHVNNAIQLNYCDIARVNYFQDVFGETLDWTKDSLVIASISIDYLNPILLYDNIVVHTKIQLIGNKSVVMLQEIVDIKTKEAKSRNSTVMACYDHQKKTTFHIYDRWIKSIEKFEGKVEYKKS